MKNALTENEFSAANDRVDSLLRSTKRGTPERAAADVVSAEWEMAIALPQSTAQQREARRAAIRATAEKLGLVSK